MNLRTRTARPGEGDRGGSPTPAWGSRRGLWPWLLAALTLVLALGVFATEIHHIADIEATALGQDRDSLWHSPVLLAILMAGMIMAATATIVVYQGQNLNPRRNQGRPQAEHGGDVRMIVGGASQLAWRSLGETEVIDGHALWNAEDRLIDYSGFLGRYLPNLAEWREPSGRQIVAALVDGGLMAPVPGLDREQTIEAYCVQRHQIPGLREYHMTDGQIFLVRTVALGLGQTASVFTNVTDMHRLRNGQLGAAAFRQAFDQAPSAEVLLDVESHPLAANHAFTALLGHGVDDLVRLGWPALLSADDPSTAPPWSNGVHRMRTAMGTSVRVAVKTRRITDDTTGDATGFLVSIEDLTDRWEADERLRLQVAALERLDHAVLAVDHSGRIAHGNHAARRLFQWPESLLVGSPIERLLGAAARSAFEAAGDEVETEGMRADGAVFPARVTLRQMDEGTPQPGGAVLTVTDLTVRRALDLQAMHSSRLATLGEMASSIAHEFNQCLHVIRLASEALQLDVADGGVDGSRIATRTANILCQVDRLTEMVTHMRAISRREGREQLPFPPQAAVNAAQHMMEPLLKADGIALHCRGSLDGLTVLGHQVRLEQVLLNLLNNSRDAICERFRHQGNTGGTIEITCSRHASGDRPHISIAVRDDGAGLPDTIRDHIFEPFVTTKEDGDGIGLGLSISRGICAEMGGSLNIGAVGNGAEFIIELPLATGSRIDRATPSPDASPLLGLHGSPNQTDDGDLEDAADPNADKRILLVDDEALSVMMIAEFLHRQGYTVDTAYDGLEAYKLCQTRVYHAVITDIRMPRMSGHELIARLAELQPGTPVIVMTGHLKEQDAPKLGGNVVAVLAKPFELHDLREHLEGLDRQPVSTRQEGR